MGKLIFKKTDAPEERRKKPVNTMAVHYRYRYIPPEERGESRPAMKVSWMNALLQLMGCVIGTYMSYKTGSALAFPLFYVPFSLGGAILSKF